MIVYTMTQKLKLKVSKLPDAPGVYLMKSKKGDLLYVGKAFSLKKRVATYFKKTLSDEKTAALVEKIHDFDIILCDTEAQALILEASLIKEKKPRYNISLRDDKSYPYVEVTKETFPRIFSSRPTQGSPSVLYGPFTSAVLIKEALKLIRNIFPYRSCRRMPKKPCLYYHLRLCPAPCAGKISTGEYRTIVHSVCKIVSGKKKSLIRSLEKKMAQCSHKGAFEEAALVRDKLFAVYALYSGKRKLNEIIQLKKTLKLKRLPLYIEAIDISTISGASATGSCVVFRDGVPDKSSYRRFRIKQARQQDDYQMIKEVVLRRYSRLLKESRPLPDLIIIDGGKGQAGAAYAVLSTLGITVSVIGIAKKHEEIWFPKVSNPVCIPHDSGALSLVKRVRDEAHRFAHKYHTLLRGKKTFLREVAGRKSNDSF